MRGRRRFRRLPSTGAVCWGPAVNKRARSEKDAAADKARSGAVEAATRP